MTVSSSPPLVRPPAFGYCTLPSGKLELGCEQRPLIQLAEQYGTPLYVYSATGILDRLAMFHRAFAHIRHTICYSIKANPNLGILKLVAQNGAGFDVVSGGELERVLRVDRTLARHVVFSGVGKTRAEMELALQNSILLFNVESAAELKVLMETATRTQYVAPLAIRVNPDVSAKTHPYISTGLQEHKFGVPIEQARRLYRIAANCPFMRVAGVSVHIGSQISDVSSFAAAMDRVAELVTQLRDDGHEIEYVDAGGGLGISYDKPQSDFAKHIEKYARAVTKPLKNLNVRLLLEPGRSLVGFAGVLLTRVLYRKTNGNKKFLIVDAAMNDLLRPALYGAHHDIAPLLLRSGRVRRELTDVVGPVCETGDFLARGRMLPVVAESEYLAVLDAGAYGSSLGSNYNTRMKPAEVLVQGKVANLVRRRETVDDVLRNEK